MACKLRIKKQTLAIEESQELNEASNTAQILHDLWLFKEYNGCSNKNCCCKNNSNLKGIVYDFHHLENAAKRKAEFDANKENEDVEWSYKETLISQKSKNGASFQILDELNNCIILCANCHRMYHYDPNYVKFRDTNETLYNFIIYVLIENQITYYKETIINWLLKMIINLENILKPPNCKNLFVYYLMKL